MNKKLVKRRLDLTIAKKIEAMDIFAIIQGKNVVKRR